MVGQQHAGQAFHKLFAYLEGHHGQHLIHEDELGGVAVLPPGAFDVGAPAGSEADVFILFFDALQAHDLPLELPGAVVKLGKQFTLPIALLVEVAQNDFGVDIPALFTAKGSAVVAFFLDHIIIRAFVKLQGIYFKIRFFAQQSFQGWLFNVEEFGGHLFAFDPGFPKVSALFPKSSALLIAPALADIHDVVVFAHFAAERQRAKQLLVFFHSITPQLHGHFPVILVKSFIVERKLGIDIGRLLAVKDLAVLFLIVRQPFRRVIYFQLVEFETLRLCIEILFWHSANKF